MAAMVFAAAVLLAIDTSQAAPQTPASGGNDPTAQEIQRRLTQQGDMTIDSIDLDTQRLRSFYQARRWKAAWTDKIDSLTPILAAADQDGLPIPRRHLTAIASRHALTTPAAIGETDLLMTDALLRFSLAMRGQRVNPMLVEDDWLIPTPGFDATAFLSSHTQDIVPALQGLQPPYAAYQLLRRELARLKGLAAAGNWPKVPVGATIKPGTSDDRILDVRKRLMATGELAADAAMTTDFDDTLQAAVKLFQQRRGLTDDAQLGRQTIAAMNLGPADLARQVAINMERWRWLPPKLEDNHILVNVPGAWMEVVENGRAVMSMRTIVGDSDHPTPALHAHVAHLVLNPTWSVPSSIATHEILPKLQKDPGYLVANDLEIVSDSFPPGSPERQGIGIDWKSYSSFPWTLRQSPGSDNALGRIKFAIPNTEDIYLHDTPNHKPFGRTNRALSHGCIRLDKPDELALYLLKDKNWTAEQLNGEIEKGDTKSVSLNSHPGVWLLYWTMWVDGDGILQIRPDIYGRDERLAAALANPASVAAPIAQQTEKTQAKPTKVICDGCRVP